MLHMKVFDRDGTLRREPSRGSARARKGRARVVAFVIGTALFMSIAPVSQVSIDATKEIKYAKQLADYQLTEKQEKCHHEIVYRESKSINLEYCSSGRLIKPGTFNKVLYRRSV